MEYREAVSIKRRKSMIIVITNRNLPVLPQSKPVDIQVKNLGVNLGVKVDNLDRIYTGGFLPDKKNTAQYRKLTFQPKGSETEIFNNISPDELAKPWVFFVHGFHQDPEENIGKAIALQNNHGVNVIAFAWPAKPLDKTISWEDSGKSALKSALSGAGWLSVLGAVAFGKIKSELDDKWYNYPPAIANAEKSNVDLIAAFKLVNAQLKSNKPPVLLVHSMGNYVLENAMKNINKLPMNFNNIVLHEPDVTAPGYEWVKKLNSNLSNSRASRLYITNNEEDYVLLASKGRRAILKIMGDLKREDSSERLGRYIEEYIPGDIHYIDFTYGEKIDDDHEFFKFPEYRTNEHVFACLGRIFRAEKGDGLPRKKNTSKSGFSKMPTDAHRYQLMEIIHITDVNEPREDIVPVKSLKVFGNKDRITFDWEEDYEL